MKTTQKKVSAADKILQNDKYYRIAADFGYLNKYSYEITKEIGRGGYGVVYKVLIYLFRQWISPITIKNAQ